LQILFVWWWTNMLFAFDLFDWIIIKNNLMWWSYDQNTKILQSFSREPISDIAKSLENDYNQNLWHRFIWLPWSIWWAVFWNAWCFWLETENNFLEAEVLDIETWVIKTLTKSEMTFSYRNSYVKNEWRFFIINVKFDLSKLEEKYSSEVDNIYFREYKQPKWNTCWSFFKNPSKEQSAWYMIDQSWLKWYKLWGAYFSDLHGNFLMNDWTGTYKDLLDLIKLCEETVKKKFSIDLVREVMIISNK
jgi:UDP-N-acetylmuramate dehydrogenase